MFDFTPFHTVSSQLGEYCNLVNQDIIAPNKIPLQKLIDTFESDPIASACGSLISSRATQLLNRPYINKSNKEIEVFVQKNFDLMEDNLSAFIASMSSAKLVGFSAAEIRFKKQQKKLWLKGFHVLNPTKISAKASHGRLTQFKYNDSGIEKYVPIWKVIHVTNGTNTCFGTRLIYGSAEIMKAYALIRLKQLIWANMAVTSRRLATGIILGKTDSNKSTLLLDPKTGKPRIDTNTGKEMEVKASFQLAQQLKTVENFGVIVTDSNNDVGTLNINGGEQFWNLAINLIDQQIMRCFQVPDTVFSAPTNPFGNGLVSSNQLSLLDANIMTFAIRLKDQLLEKVVRPLIYLNFGKGSTDTLGDWDIHDEINEQKNQQILGNLIQAMGMGVLNSQDYDAVNALREKLDLPKINVETVAQQKELEAKLQALQQKVAMAGQQEQAPTQVPPEEQQEYI
jgi:hypothetical protein